MKFPKKPFIDIPNPDLKIHPLLNTPEPKSRFVPSKWEAKRIAYLVKAIRKGWIKLDKKDEEIEPLSLIWDDEIVSTEKNKRLNMHIPPPSVKLPGLYPPQGVFQYFIILLIFRHFFSFY